jgi:pimeloyl-ACP methyl ester carboxylesterase
MRIVHVAVTTRAGRWATRRVTGTRITGSRWNPVPLSPVEVAGAIPPVPFLVVHGEEDPFVGPEHGRALARAAGPTADLWVIRGMGHAENAVDADLAGAVVRWIVAAVRGLPRPDAPVRGRSAGA